MNDRIIEIREELTKMAEREAIALWRLARHGFESKKLKPETIEEIREEARRIWNIRDAYPERLLDRCFTNQFKYAFKA